MAFRPVAVRKGQDPRLRLANRHAMQVFAFLGR